MGKQPFRVEAVLPENARTYFLERDSAAFRALLAKVLKLGVVEMTDVWKQEESTFVRLVTRPDFGNWVPKGVQSQVNMKSIEFHDVIEYNPALISQPPFQVNVKTESPFLGDKLDVRLSLIIEEVDENTCRQVLTGHIRVNMFGVGRIVEGIVKDSLQNTYKKLPEIVRRWQAFRCEALQSGNAKQLLSGRPPVGLGIGWIRAEVLTVMQSPIEAMSVLPPPSPTAVMAPEDRSQLSTDEAAETVAPMAAGAGVEPAETQAAAAAAASKGVGAEAAPAAEPFGQEETEGEPSPRRTNTEYYDAIELLEEDSASSIPRAGGEAPAPRQRSMQRKKGWDLKALRVELPPAPEGVPGHRRNVSVESAGSSEMAAGEAGESSPFQKRPTSQRSWHGFNNSYEEWTAYWDIMGVKHMAPREPPSGPLGLLWRTEEAIRESFSTVMFSVYLFALRKGVITVQPNQDGRYAGRPPRMNLDIAADAAQQPARPLHRQQSAPAVQHQQQLWRQAGGEGEEAVGPLPGADVQLGLQADGRQGSGTAAASRYGNTDQAAALVARLSMRAPGLQQRHHRRAVSVDTGTTAAAKAAAAAEVLDGPGRPGSKAAAGGGATPGNAAATGGGATPGKAAAGGGGGTPPRPAPARRRTTAGHQPPEVLQEEGEEERDDLIHPKFTCLPVCWHRRRTTPAPRP